MKSYGSSKKKKSVKSYEFLAQFSAKNENNVYLIEFIADSSCIIHDILGVYNAAIRILGLSSLRPNTLFYYINCITKFG